MVDMIQINDLKFSYPDGSAALRGVSLSVKHGEFVTLCGLSGCGKSTLLRDIAADGCAVLLVTHDTELAAECADVCGMLFNGEILNEASPEEMFRENYFYTTPMARLIRGISENK